VGDDGRVYVPFAGLTDGGAGESDADRRRYGWVVESAGVWVFEPAPAAPEEAATPGRCVVLRDKTAGPAEVFLGESVEVALEVTGSCPGHYEPMQLMVVFDTSFSMHHEYYARTDGRGGLDHGRDLVLELLAGLDPDATEVGVVTFDDGAALEVPLGGPIDAALAAITQLKADGDTRMGAGIDLALRELAGPELREGAKQTILVVSDGIFKDDPAWAVEAAHEAGVEVVAVVLSTREFDGGARSRLETLLGGSQHLFLDPVPDDVSHLVERVSTYVPNPGLLETVTIRDVVPANMRYELDSAVPPAVYDEAARTLSWTLGPVDASGQRLTYRVEPQEEGLWPTNVEATADYRDALGSDGRLVFPVPQVRVIERVYRAYLTIVTAGSCRLTERPMDIVLLLDVSSSMNEPAGGELGGSKLDAARAAARSLVGLLNPEWHRVAVVAFDARPTRLTGLTADLDAADRALAGLRAGSGTRIDLALAEARRLLAGEVRQGVLPGVVVLSDGLQNGTADAVLSEAKALRDLRSVLYFIGLGENADRDVLERAASSPAHFVHSPSAEDLEDIYHRIALGLVCRE
jgi:Mg-chelatase subunit ChlD